MHRLTFQTPDGHFGVEGIDLTKLDAKLYGCICKLKAYEEIGLSPDEVERLNEFSESQMEKLMDENARLRADLERAKAGKNDAVADLVDSFSYGQESDEGTQYDIRLCDYCQKYHEKCSAYGCDAKNFVFRGRKKEEGPGAD